MLYIVHGENRTYFLTGTTLDISVSKILDSLFYPIARQCNVICICDPLAFLFILYTHCFLYHPSLCLPLKTPQSLSWLFIWYLHFDAPQWILLCVTNTCMYHHVCCITSLFLVPSDLAKCLHVASYSFLINSCLNSLCLHQCFSTFMRPRPSKFFFPWDEGPVPTDLLVNTFPIVF